MGKLKLKLLFQLEKLRCATIIVENVKEVDLRSRKNLLLIILLWEISAGILTCSMPENDLISSSSSMVEQHKS